MEPSLPRVFGPYYLLAPLGRGAAGAAYLAKPIDPQRQPPLLVVKCLHSSLASDDEFVRRFIHEAQIAVRVDGPHVAKTFDVGAVGDTLYIALDYVPGWTLGKLLAGHVDEGRPPSVAVACGVVAQAADGLAALHDAVDRDGRPLEAIHRDVSPKNLMVGDDGVVRVIDFGLGRSKAQDWKTAAGRVMGSPGYMPPEQIRGERVDRRADVYALGVVLHELLVGARYIDADGSLERLKQSLKKPFVAPSSLRGEVPAAVDEVVRSAMAPRREDRTADASAFAAALRAATRVADARSIAAWVAGELTDLGERRRRRVAELAATDVPGEEAESAKTRVFVQRSDLFAAAAAGEAAMGGATITRTIEPAPRRARRWPAVVFAVAVTAAGAGFVGGVMWTEEAAPVAAPAGAPGAGRSEAGATLDSVARSDPVSTLGSGADLDSRSDAESGSGSASASDSGSASESGSASGSGSASTSDPDAASASSSSVRSGSGERWGEGKGFGEGEGARSASGRARRVRKRRVRRAPPPAPAAAPAPPPAPAERARRLRQRLAAITTDDADTKTRVARLLAQVSMVKNAPASPKVDAQLDRIERDVRALEGE